MAKIFITGIAGFLGSHLAENLLLHGHEVSGVDHCRGGYRENVPERVNWYWGDCEDLSWLKIVLHKVKPDVVVHCAALAHEGLSVFSPHIISKNILGATTAILAASISAQVKRFVFCSSRARYGTLNPPYTEDLIPQPKDPYGIAKVAAEEMVKNLCTIHGMEYVIAVPHDIIGTKQKYDDPYRNVVAITINRMLQGLQPVLYGGDQQRGFTSVKDCVSCLREMCFRPVSGEIINIGADEYTMTIREVQALTAEIMGIEYNPLVLPPRPQEMQYSLCPSEKARRLLGYKTTEDPKKTITDMVLWIKEKGPKPFQFYLPLEIEAGNIPEPWRNRGNSKRDR